MVVLPPWPGDEREGQHDSLHGPSITSEQTAFPGVQAERVPHRRRRPIADTPRRGFFSKRCEKIRLARRLESLVADEDRRHLSCPVYQGALVPMWGSFGWLSRQALGGPDHSRAFVRTTRVLGLVEYPAINPSNGSTTRGGNEADDVAGERSLLCLALPSPRLPVRSRSAGRGGMFSVVLHIAAVSIVMSLAAWSRSRTPPTVAATPDRPQVPRLVFVLQPGPGGGGGGGGNRQPAPSRARAVGRDRLTVPVVTHAEMQPSRSDEMPREQQLLLDAEPLAAETSLMTGLLDASPLLPFSRGPGTGAGVGSGTGSGIGPGVGSGIGAGSDGGFGGGAYRAGNGVVPPTLLKQVTPRYTAEAMRQRIQGVVALEVIIGRDGIPQAFRVTRSLEPGLDEEAIAAARQWRFAPGRVGDTPVEVIVTIVLDFNIR